MLSSDDTSEEQLEEVMKEVEAEEAEEDAKEQQAVAFLQSREEKKMAIQVESSGIFCRSGFSPPPKSLMARSLTSICLLQAALKSGVHRARFGVRQTPGLSQVRNHDNLFERR